MINQTLKFYKNNHKKLIKQYNSVSFKSVHQDWLEFLPSKESLILDIGAGSGRDACWLSEIGYQVIAVEPVMELFSECTNNQPEWIVDSLPALQLLKKYYNKAALILLSAVWMHLTTQERIQSFQSFAKLNKKKGLLVITLRHGKSPDERLMYSVSINEIATIAETCHYQLKSIKKSDDQLSRSDVFWETIVLEKIS